jgi:MATE family multidrug resistance protein
MINSKQQALSHRRVWMLAGPIMLSNISVPLVGAVDSAVVGRLPEPTSIGAVALGALIFSFLYWGFGFLRMGTTGFIARAFGANDQTALSDTLLRVIMLALSLGGCIVLFGSPLINLALYLLQSTEAVERLTADYAAIRVWSAPATLCLYVFTGVFIAMHNTAKAFALQLILNITNVLLDLWFVMGLGYGVEGVASATVIAEYLAAGVGFFLLRNQIIAAVVQIHWPRLFEGDAVIDLMRTNSDIFVRTLCLTFAFAYFTAESARFGDSILAANAILMHLQSISAYALDGFAHAAEALVGSAYGAGQRDRLKRSVLLTSLWAFITSIVICAIFWIFGEEILKLFTNIPSVLEHAMIYLPWMIISPVLSIWSFQLDGIFIGTGFTREMRNAMLLSLLVYLIALVFLLPAFGNHGLFLGLSFFMLIRALSLFYYYPAIVKSISPTQRS